MPIVIAQANATRQSGNFANQLVIDPLAQLNIVATGPRLPLILLLFRRVHTWSRPKMANKRRKNTLMKKYFWHLGCAEAPIRSDARRADRPMAAASGSIAVVAGCWSASSIVPNGTNTLQANTLPSDRWNRHQINHAPRESACARTQTNARP
jgi:hypothetical protein